ncbi:Protein ABHD11 like protein [Argiope bruennichi]|uniref:sn-1-specific diacylglycerol lipase ABHD11 n=1 Tax=Argiope bruennichi TaxID=94029 RepID=A0A8T0FJ58_ARGBR|nr:Protein ABHD11 like protein [Argiope bruennichi]
MLWLASVVCISIFWAPSVSSSDLASKPKPVDLAYSCLRASEDTCSSDDVPIILIHGLSSFKESWKGISEVLALKTGKKVCVADLRNHGESPWSDEADTAAMTEDIKHLLDKLEIPKAVVLGHSLGGKVTVHLALNYPERVEKAIVEDMRPNGLSTEGIEELFLYLNLFKDIETLIPQGVSEREAKELFLKNFNDYLAKSNTSLSYDDPEMFPIKCIDGKCRWGTNTLLFKILMKDINSLWTESSGRFDGPGLFIYGTKSNFKIGDDESNIKKLFPNAKLVGVKGAGHVVHENPEFMTEVIKFIKESNFEH